MNPKKQKSPYQNPWPWWTQVLLICWRFSWLVFCRWTPKFFNPWRIFVLKIFGAKLSGTPFIHSTARIQIPWNLTMKHRACLGERANAYSLGKIKVMEGATIAQESYLCTGSHDFNNPSLQLITKPITIGKNTFIGARAMILPGVSIGNQAIVGAMSVLSKDVPDYQIVAGNPAKKIGERAIS
ncbi:putative colanic acid biosynthesis acetyltransferase [Opitutales bacterium]|nr:putative colanic acid biosynthesis acetyltransferase [Opitutales bacterium]